MKIRIKVKQLVLFVLLPLALLILIPAVLQQAAAPSVQPATSATADTGSSRTRNAAEQAGCQQRKQAYDAYPHYNN